MKINIVFTIFIFSLPFYTQAQNLVPNPGFESYTSCPSYFSQIFEATPWQVPPGHAGTPDYFNTCAPVASFVNVPDNFIGSQYAATGNGYAGIYLYIASDTVSKLKTEFREYIETRLISPLINGFVYKVSIKYSLASSSFFSTSSFGIALQSTPISSPFYTYTHIDYTPQWTATSNLDVTNGWGVLEFKYFATGGERFLALGNFNANANTPLTKNVNWKSNPIYERYAPGNYVYTYLDDISIVSLCDSLPVFSLGNDTTVCQGTVIPLHTSLTNKQYLWQNGSTVLGFTVTQPGVYWLKVTDPQTLCSYADTIRITNNPLPVIRWGADTIIYDTAFTLNAENPNSTYLWQNASVNPVYLGTQEGAYWVKVVTDKGCAKADTISVKFGKIILDMPNVFTPNHDGVNDFFLPARIGGIQTLCINLYNRWGEKVYTSCDLNFSWNGEGYPEGLYYYSLQYTNAKNIGNSKNGWLQLLR